MSITSNATHLFSYTPGPEALRLVAAAVEARVQREYGQFDISWTVLEINARLVVAVEAREAWMAATGGSDSMIGVWAGSEVRRLIREGLEARECQCRQLGLMGLGRGHLHANVCAGHFERDVPPTAAGLKLCGTCYIAEA